MLKEKNGTMNLTNDKYKIIIINVVLNITI